jgi:ribosomal protein L29
MSKTVEELKAMTPEERQKYIEEMKAKYQQH